MARPGLEPLRMASPVTGMDAFTAGSGAMIVRGTPGGAIGAAHDHPGLGDSVQIRRQIGVEPSVQTRHVQVSDASARLATSMSSSPSARAWAAGMVVWML
jgi:hypothetical protein